MHSSLAELLSSVLGSHNTTWNALKNRRNAFYGYGIHFYGRGTTFFRRRNAFSVRRNTFEAARNTLVVRFGSSQPCG